MHVTAECFDATHGDLLRKIAQRGGGSSCYRGVHLRYKTLCAYNAEESVRLTAFEFQILWLLVRGQGGIITRDEIAYFLYEEDDNDLPLSNSVHAMICRIRRKLVKLSADFSVEIVRSLGYRLG